jgi:hypothetical protein
VLTQPLIFALAAALAGGFAWPFQALLAATAAVRVLAVRIQERALHLTPAPGRLLVLREFLTFAVFIAALWGRTVQWRGTRFRIHPDGTMQPVKEAAP